MTSEAEGVVVVVVVGVVVRGVVGEVGETVVLLAAEREVDGLVVDRVVESVETVGAVVVGAEVVVECVFEPDGRFAGRQVFEVGGQVADVDTDVFDQSVDLADPVMRFVAGRGFPVRARSESVIVTLLVPAVHVHPPMVPL